MKMKMKMKMEKMKKKKMMMMMMMKMKVGMRTMRRQDRFFEGREKECEVCQLSSRLCGRCVKTLLGAWKRNLFVCFAVRSADLEAKTKGRKEETEKQTLSKKIDTPLVGGGHRVERSKEGQNVDERRRSRRRRRGS